MRIKFFILTICAILITKIQAQTFNKTDGYATDIAINNDGDIYAVGISKQIFKYNFREGKFKVYATANRSAKAIAASTTLNYVLDTNGKLYKIFNSNTKSMVPSRSGTYIDVCSDKANSLFSIDKTGLVAKHGTRIHNNKRYSYYKQLPLGKENKKVSIKHTDHFFVIKNNNTIYEYNKGRPRKLPGAATDIAYDHVQQKLYVLGVSKRIFVWNPRRNNWDLVKNTRNDFKSIAVHNGKLWGTTTRNEIYTTANVRQSAPRPNQSGNYYKLKITLTNIECFKNGDGGTNPDDYYLDFYTDLSINNRAYTFSKQELVKLEKDIKPVKKDYLYLNHMWRAGKKATLGEVFGSQHEAALVNKHRQLFAAPRKPAGINNSGVYLIPKATSVSTFNTQFYVGATLDEISRTTLTRITSGKRKINLKKVLDYLNKTIDKNSFSIANAPYYKMGTGYTSLSLDEARDGHRSMRGYFYGRVNKNGKLRTAQVNYTIELID
ncbi:hypothetical protein MHTCC0001_30520 [Flavobacteriaceae bacterium MHTCC 0001]